MLMEISRLVQQLPSDQLTKMQTLMHNTMAGVDVRKEMEEFEKNLPPAFRIRMATLLANQGMNPAGTSGPKADAPPIEVAAEPTSLSAVPGEPESSDAPIDMNLREARITILRAVSVGNMTPEEAEKLLFS